MEEMHTFLP